MGDAVERGCAVGGLLCVSDGRMVPSDAGRREQWRKGGAVELESNTFLFSVFSFLFRCFVYLRICLLDLSLCLFCFCFLLPPELSRCMPNAKEIPAFSYILTIPWLELGPWTGWILMDLIDCYCVGCHFTRLENIKFRRMFMRC